MKNNTYIRSSKLSTKFLNKRKLEELHKIIDEYHSLTQKFINYFWTLDMSNLPKYCFSNYYNMFPSFLGSYLKQSAGKQALSIVRGTYQKQKQRMYIYNKLLTEGKIKQANKLKKIIDSTNMSCPVLKQVEIELGGNPSVVKLENSKTSFDNWLYLSLTPTLLNKTYIPLKRNKHFNKLLDKGGILSKGCRISKNFITFSFSFEKEPKPEGKTLGIDIGIKNIISCSNGFQSKGLEHIQRKMSRKKKGSKAFARCQIERKNYINHIINQLDLTDVSLVKRENIKNIKKYKRNSRFMQSWTYTEIFNKLDRYCEEQNVSVLPIEPTYTSQRCSVCGYVLKSNRNGKQFKCKACGYTGDSDLNASKNIAFNLPSLGKNMGLLHKNKKGFYWYEEGQEFIVPVTSRNKK